jgi:glutamate-1-semialdehyde 2,1-aminomutase
MPAGIPQAIRDLTVRFAFDDLPALSRLLDEHDNQVACIVLEAATAVEASPGYFTGLRRLCDERGVLLVLDEMITGFRWGLGGAQALYGIDPDLSTFGKAMGNGFAVSALAGRREYMERGGWNHGEERVFLLSTTHGAETHALAASIAVIEEFRARPVPEHLAALGERLATGVRAAAASAGVGEHVVVLGHPANLVYATLDENGERSQAYRTLFMQELLRRGILAPSFVVSDALTLDDVDATIEAVFLGCEVYARALQYGIDGYLSGRPVRPAIRPFS